MLQLQCWMPLRIQLESHSYYSIAFFLVSTREIEEERSIGSNWVQMCGDHWSFHFFLRFRTSSQADLSRLTHYHSEKEFTLSLLHTLVADQLMNIIVSFARASSGLQLYNIWELWFVLLQHQGTHSKREASEHVKIMWSAIIWMRYLCMNNAAHAGCECWCLSFRAGGWWCINSSFHVNVNVSQRMKQRASITLKCAGYRARERRRRNEKNKAIKMSFTLRKKKLCIFTTTTEQ